MFWIKNSKGSASASLTFYTISFFVVCLAIILGMVKNITVGSFSLQFENPSETLLLGFMTLAGGSYIYRSTKGDNMEHRERLAAMKHAANAVVDSDQSTKTAP